jgi:hypothetical protein
MAARGQAGAPRPETKVTDELRDALAAAISADAETLAQRLDTLPRDQRRAARRLLREAWSFTENPTGAAAATALARELDALLTPVPRALGDGLWQRLHQHWPLRLPCLEPRIVARAGEAAAAFHDVRQARVDWLWRQMKTDDSAARDPSGHGAVATLDFPIVDKGGSK